MRVWRAMLGLLAISLGNVSIGAQTQPAVSVDQPPLTLEELEVMALTNNPTMRQATAGIDAARGRARQAGTLPNPTIGYVADEVNGGPVIRGGEHGFFIEQTVPLGGKLRLGRQIFDRVADEAQALVELQQQRIRSAVRTLYYEALTMERRVQVQDRLAQLASEAVSISAQLFNVGAADRPDVLESEIEAKRAQIELIAARNRQFAVWRRLAAMVGDSRLTPRTLAASIDTAIPELDRASALRQAAERSPEVRAARADVERNRAMVAQARRSTFPDLFLRGGSAYNRELLETTIGGTPRAVGWEASVEADGPGVASRLHSLVGWSAMKMQPLSVISIRNSEQQVRFTPPPIIQQKLTIQQFGPLKDQPSCDVGNNRTDEVPQVLRLLEVVAINVIRKIVRIFERVRHRFTILSYVAG